MVSFCAHIANLLCVTSLSYSFKARHIYTIKLYRHTVKIWQRVEAVYLELVIFFMCWQPLAQIQLTWPEALSYLSQDVFTQLITEVASINSNSTGCLIYLIYTVYITNGDCKYVSTGSYITVQNLQRVSNM